MTECQIRELVAEVMVLRNSLQWRAEDDALIASGAVLNSQVGGADIRERSAQLRAMSPGTLLLQSDLETGSYFAADGQEVPPLMALGATNNEQLAHNWGYAIGLEGRRLGLDVTWSPVLDVNTNPDNPIINVRSFGESVELVSRLGAAVVQGLHAAGLHACAKHWPGHGDVAVDSHISLPTLPLSRERLDAVEWEPYRHARAAGLESVMTGHLLVPTVDPHLCATISPTLISLLRNHLGYDGVLFTDSLGMEGLRLTLDSAEAAWRALAAGHDQVLVDYKRPPGESVEATVAACLSGQVPEKRLLEAAAKVRDLKQRRQNLPPLPEEGVIRETVSKMARAVAEASVTLCGEGSLPPELGARPLLVICDDLGRFGVGIADEQAGQQLQGAHPLATMLRSLTPCEVVVCSETPTAEQLAAVQQAAAQATGIIGATFAHIQCYKGDGTRLPVAQVGQWQSLAASGKLRALALLESPYALADLPSGYPVVVGYGGDDYTLQAVAEALLGKRPCPGRLPVSV
jgi:beta-N-acetylhexosaminidase